MRGGRARGSNARRRRRACPAAGPARARAPRTRAAPRPSRPSAASSPTSSARRPTWPSAWSPSRPDVGTSTNLGGWINRAGIWAIGDRIDWFADDTDTLVRWRESTHGRHIELGIAEVNLVGLLGELGATWSRDGQPLLPVGTIYDPFVARALEPWSFGIYAGGQSILVGTPSGVTLGPEGGAHQSVITPSVGIEQPGCVAWEPAFGQDLEWCLLHALSRLGRPDGTSAYFRLSTRPIDQALHARHARRRRIARRLPAAAAAERARASCWRSWARSCPRRWRRRTRWPPRRASRPRWSASPAPTCSSAPSRPAPAWATATRAIARALPARGARRHRCSTAIRTRSPSSASARACLGVQRFGQSGDLAELYEHHQIDAESVVGAALDLLGA